jgi:hypothetical protein
VKPIRVIKNGCLIPLITIVLIGWLTSYLYSYNYWSGAIPAEISIGRKLKSETPIITSPGGSAGYAVFKLKTSTIDKIEQSGLEYLTKKTRPRKWNSRIRWIETGENPSLSIYTNYNKKYKNALRNAFKADGSFLGSCEKNTRILIIPSEGLLIVGYFDL